MDGSRQAVSGFRYGIACLNHFEEPRKNHLLSVPSFGTLYAEMPSLRSDSPLSFLRIPAQPLDSGRELDYSELMIGFAAEARP